MSNITIQAIAFDWGGIFTEGTFDSAAAASLAQLYQCSVEDINAVYLPLMAELERGAMDFEAFHARFGEGMGKPCELDIFRELFLGSIHERVAMFQVLQSVPKDYRVAMLSNNVPLLCDVVRDDPRMQRIEHFVFSNEIGVRKPDAKAFAALSEALEVAPQATVFIDDNADNIAACEALGFQGIHLDTMAGFRQRWQALLPDVPLHT